MFARSLPSRLGAPRGVGYFVAGSVLLGLAAAPVAAPAQGSARPAGIVGVWLTEHGDAKMRFAPCGAAVCGKIVWLKDPSADGHPKTDVNNSDPAKRGRPLLGLTIFTDLRPVADEWRGHAYNSDDGRDYEVEIKRVDDGRLTVSGCALGGMFCGGETWTRG